MDAIDKIVEQIREEGQKEIETYQAKEKLRIDEQMEEQMLAINEQERAQIQKNEQILTKEFKQKSNRQQLDVRQSTLNKKQGYLLELFHQAVKIMEAWTKPEFQEFAEQALSHLTLTGASQIIMGERSKDYLDAAWVKAFNQKYKTSFILTTTVLPHEGGFVVEQEGIEYNFLFASLVREVQEKESSKVAQILFG